MPLSPLGDRVERMSPAQQNRTPRRIVVEIGCVVENDEAPVVGKAKRRTIGIVTDETEARPR